MDFLDRLQALIEQGRRIEQLLGDSSFDLIGFDEFIGWELLALEATDDPREQTNHFFVEFQGMVRCIRPDNPDCIIRFENHDPREFFRLSLERLQAAIAQANIPDTPPGTWV